MDRAPWIALGIATVFASASRLSLQDWVTPATTSQVATLVTISDGKNPRDSPDTVQDKNPPPPSTPPTNTTPQLEWILTEPFVMVYDVNSPPVKQLRGYIGVRSKAAQGGSLHFALFILLRPDLSQSEAILEVPQISSSELLEAPKTDIVLDSSVPRSIPVMIKLPFECKIGAFDSLLRFTSLKRSEGCPRLQGYVFTEFHPKAKDKVGEDKLIRWSASIPKSPGLQVQAITGAAVWAAIVVAIALIVSWINKHPPWQEMAGSPNWDFSKSWAANTALAGTLLVALIGFSNFPADPVLLPKGAYVFINIWATALIGLGPMVYAAFSRTKTIDSKQVICGRIALFLIGAFFVLWAGLIQLRAVRLMVAELALDKILSAEFESIISNTLDVIFLILISYGIYSLIKTIKEQTQGTGIPAPATWSLL